MNERDECPVFSALHLGNSYRRGRSLPRVTHERLALSFDCYCVWKFVTSAACTHGHPREFLFGSSMSREPALARSHLWVEPESRTLSRRTHSHRVLMRGNAWRALHLRKAEDSAVDSFSRIHIGIAKGALRPCRHAHYPEENFTSTKWFVSLFCGLCISGVRCIKIDNGVWVGWFSHHVLFMRRALIAGAALFYWILLFAFLSLLSTALILLSFYALKIFLAIFLILFFYPDRCITGRLKMSSCRGWTTWCCCPKYPRMPLWTTSKSDTTTITYLYPFSWLSIYLIRA